MQVVFNYLVSRGLFYPHKVVKPLFYGGIFVRKQKYLPEHEASGMIVGK